MMAPAGLSPDKSPAANTTATVRRIDPPPSSHCSAADWRWRKLPRRCRGVPDRSLAPAAGLALRPVSKLDPRVVAVWRWSVALWGAGAAVVAAVVGWILHHTYGWWPLVSVVAVSVTAAVVSVWKGPPAVWAAWSYRLTNDSLELARGVLFREHSVIPWSRVQHVDISHGPLDRRFGLAQLQIHTASGKSDAKLPGLDADEAERLRLDILDRYRQSLT